jgi:hypothetical protein
MGKPLASWERPLFVPGGGEAVLFYAVFGDVSSAVPLWPSRYRTKGVPPGFSLTQLSWAEHGDYLAEFCKGYVWDRLREENPQLADRVAVASKCLVLSGTQEDPPTLDYLRDCVGILTYLTDIGASAIYDVQVLRWWAPAEWRDTIFTPAAPVPRHHAVVLVSEDESRPGLSWYHTRGMRKFGRPDLSVRRVAADFRDAVIDLCERFIDYQALGGLIQEGQGIKMKSLPPGGVARHAGDADDPDFNNVHVEIAWPEPGLSQATS